MDYETLTPGSYYVSKDIKITVNKDGSLIVRARNLDPLTVRPNAANQVTITGDEPK